jgi:DNA segregation ATPase FtsK/SpoIIIE, S-DNA-T family
VRGVKYKHDASEPRVRGEALKVGFGAVVAGWAGKQLARGLWWLVRQPPVWLVAVLAVVGFRVHGWFGTVGLVLAGSILVVGLVAWAVLHRRSFLPVVWWPLKAWGRQVAVYLPGWHELMAVTGLEKSVKGVDLVPRLVRVRSTSTVDRVRVRTLRGQKLSDFADNAERFAESIGAVDCRIRSVVWPGVQVFGRQLVTARRRARRLDLWFLTRDPLTAPVPLAEVSARPNLKRLVLALREDGLPWTLRLLGTHVLVAGMTGAGKGSVLWSLIRSVAAGIADRSVELWVIDPKGGMELAAGQPLFARYCYGDTRTDDEGQKRVYQLDFAEFLEGAVEQMRDRQARLRGVFRTHKAKPGDPHIVILIDELACLTAYVTDRKVKARIDAALGLLLSQGRACGISVVAALQDARKEVLPNRGLFPTRIGLALGEEEETDLVLGKAARKNGARCDEISEDTPGVAFVAVEELREPVRVRFGYVDDDEIARLARDYRPGVVPLHAIDGTTSGEEAVA